MCGIVGIVSKRVGGLFDQDREMFEELLLVDQVRGDDATGAFGVTRKGQVRVVKQAAEPNVLMSTPNWKTFRDLITRDFFMVVGHNRKATTGKNSSENAHPFSEGDITLVHNGVIYDHKKLNSEVEVDSHALVHGFVDKGYEETLRDIYGAWALAWFNRHDQTLRLIRNEERPLAFVETKDYFYFASELDMLKWILGRNHLTTKDVMLSGMIPKWKMIEIKINPFRMTMKDLDLRPPVTIGLPHREAPAQQIFTRADEMPDRTEEIKELMRDRFTDVFEGPNVEHLKSVKNEGTLLTKGRLLNKMYPLGSKVIFRLQLMKPWHDDKYVLTGLGYLPGIDPIQAKHWFSLPISEDDVLEYMDQKVLVGKVKALIPKGIENKEEQMIIDPIEIPEKVATWPNHKIPVLEWSHICDLQICDGCQKSLRGMPSSLCLVHERTPGKYLLHCPVCVKKNLSSDQGFLQNIGVKPENLKALNTYLLV